TPRGFHYCLSQRAQHICQEISGATTSSRSIINTRDEPHADAERYRRLHVIVGDSNMSEFATFIKIGTTALVLDMIEDGFFDRDYSLQSPVQAIRDISHDPTLRETIKLKDGRSISALDLQLEYLEYATRYVETIEAAKHKPPQTTRARLRGEFIRQANLKGKDYRVDWVYLKLNDPERETILCKDPFQSHDERVERLIRSF